MKIYRNIIIIFLVVFLNQKTIYSGMFFFCKNCGQTVSTKLDESNKAICKWCGMENGKMKNGTVSDTNESIQPTKLQILIKDAINLNFFKFIIDDFNVEKQKENTNIKDLEEKFNKQFGKTCQEFESETNLLEDKLKKTIYELGLKPYLVLENIDKYDNWSSGIINIGKYVFKADKNEVVYILNEYNNYEEIEGIKNKKYLIEKTLIINKNLRISHINKSLIMEK